MEERTKEQNGLKYLGENFNHLCNELAEDLQRIKMIEEEIKEHKKTIAFTTAKLKEATDDLSVKTTTLATKKKDYAITTIENIALMLDQ